MESRIRKLKNFTKHLEDIKCAISDEFTTGDSLVDLSTRFIVTRIEFLQDVIQEAIREMRRYQIHEMEKNKTN